MAEQNSLLNSEGDMSSNRLGLFIPNRIIVRKNVKNPQKFFQTTQSDAGLFSNDLFNAMDHLWKIKLKLQFEPAIKFMQLFYSG